jgi:hypothetical protein
MKNIISATAQKLILWSLGMTSALIAVSAQASLLGQTITMQRCAYGTCYSGGSFIAGSTIIEIPGNVGLSISADADSIIMQYTGVSAAVSYYSPGGVSYDVGGLILHNGYLFDIGQQVSSLFSYTEKTVPESITFSDSRIAVELQNHFVGSGSTIVMHVNSVPIPAAAWMFGSGLVGLTALGRKRKAA